MARVPARYAAKPGSKRGPDGFASRLQPLVQEPCILSGLPRTGHLPSGKPGENGVDGIKKVETMTPVRTAEHGAIGFDVETIKASRARHDAEPDVVAYPATVVERAEVGGVLHVSRGLPRMVLDVIGKACILYPVGGP